MSNRSSFTFVQIALPHRDKSYDSSMAEWNTKQVVFLDAEEGTADKKIERGWWWM